jgi:superfamily II DNA/RNA helicase
LRFIHQNLKFSCSFQRPPGKFTKASLPAMKSRSDNQLTEQEREAAIKAFEGLGLCTQLAEAAASLGWKQPSVIQQQALPPLLQGGSVRIRTCQAIAQL